MRLRQIAFTLVLAIGGCAWLHNQARPPAPARPASLGVANVEIDRIAFVGPTLNFRVVIGAADGSVVLDRRLTPNADVEITDARDCDAGQPLTYSFAEYLPMVPGPSDLIELKPGEWFGKDEQFPIFIWQQRQDGGIPDCVDATFFFRPQAALNESVFFHVKGSLVAPPDGGEPVDSGH